MINSKHSFLIFQAYDLLQDIKNYTASFFHGKLFKLIDVYLPKMAQTLPEPYLR